MKKNIVDILVITREICSFRLGVICFVLISFFEIGFCQYSNYEYLLAEKVLSIETKVYKSNNVFERLGIVEEGGGYYTENVKFNDYGDVIEIYRLKEGRHEIFKSFTYSKSKLIESRKYKEGILDTKESYEYDTEGRLEKYEKSVRGEIWESNTNIYYSDGFKSICKKPKYNLEHEVISYTDELGNVLKTVDNELFLPEEVIYEYDRQNRLLSKVGKGRAEYFKYLANDDYIVDNYLEDVLSSTKKYNSNHQLVKRQYMDKNGLVKSTVTTLYDVYGYGYPVTIGYDFPPRPFSVTSLDYTLDNNGNVIEIKYKNEIDNLYFVIERKIEYMN